MKNTLDYLDNNIASLNSRLDWLEDHIIKLHRSKTDLFQKTRLIEGNFDDRRMIDEDDDDDMDYTEDDDKELDNLIYKINFLQRQMKFINAKNKTESDEAFDNIWGKMDDIHQFKFKNIPLIDTKQYELDGETGDSIVSDIDTTNKSTIVINDSRYSDVNIYYYIKIPKSGLTYKNMYEQIDDQATSYKKYYYPLDEEVHQQFNFMSKISEFQYEIRYWNYY
jgi:hypothetical protein|tara:strand:- start:228 stop:893 length:666 start_codon:yes stop_codon:yes gene_type:complete